MEEIIRTLNRLRDEGILLDWALGGGMATLFYTEPFLTDDVDVFSVLPDMPGRLDILGSLFQRLQEMGYSLDGLYVRIGGTSVQFLIPPSALEAEALKNANQLVFGDVPLKVFRPVPHRDLSANRPHEGSSESRIAERAGRN